MDRRSFTLMIAIIALSLGACSSKQTTNEQPVSGAGAGAGGVATGAAGTGGKTSTAGQGGQTLVANGGTGGSSLAGAGGHTSTGGAGGIAGAAGRAGASGAGAGGAGGNSAGSGGTGDTAFDTCVASLKKCSWDDLETACSSITSIPIPLTAGGNYGPKETKMGVYGSYIEWNEGKNTEFVTAENTAAEAYCIPTGIESFAEPQSVSAATEDLRGMDHTLYTVFRPACFKKGEKYPVITWANGTCGETLGYSGLLTAVASHGFVVFASNSTWTATSPTNTVQLRALDFAKAVNEDPTSIYYQKLDLDKVGAMGHSQGSMATATAASDPRIKAIILWNSGTSNNKPFLEVSGDRDIGGTNTPTSMNTAVNSATQPGAWMYYHQVLETGGTATGHLVLMEQAERVVDMAVAWWKYILNGDAEAKKMFIGDSCGLCNHKEEYEYGHNSLLK